MSKVFIIEADPRKNFVSAQKYGELEVIFHQNTSMGVSDNNDILSILNNRLSLFNPNTDYIIPTGDPAIMFAAGHVLGLLDIDFIKVLKWDRQSNQYFIVTIGV
jgi:hypothetical protein